MARRPGHVHVHRREVQRSDRRREVRGTGAAESVSMIRRVAMFRRALLIALIAVVAVPIAVQVQGGWKVRLDGSPGAAAATATSTVKVAPTEKGFHLTGGPGAVIFDPTNTVKPIFRVRATFTLLKAADKATQYGLFFGGNEMEGAAPTYVYFTIAQDGTFQIRHRAGAQ